MGAGRELFGLCKDGTEVPVEIGLSPFRTSHGLMVLSTIVDISERRRAAEREQLLVRDHRTNNVFAVVQAIVARSLSADLTLEQARRVLDARLQGDGADPSAAERRQLERSRPARDRARRTRAVR